eukprot:CAMPEP_0116837580 /NCGR_PEP_ID=MMETSP0418-20121206/8729_1 /TAXON_ID=1158023 /ORGANISM="Astrosyne radiata, Strain 13vi08-1A" /LENGTH=380 /DNA_ID=CAMNT_0004467473 /DNA_START=369 /DNA_END=1511 /DNA_ORIENTATION=+
MLNPNSIRDWIRVGNVVQVESRTTVGINKLGGVGEITKVHNDHHGFVFSVDVKYVVSGGTEKQLDLGFITPYQTLSRQSRSRRGRDFYTPSRTKDATTKPQPQDRTSKQKTTSAAPRARSRSRSRERPTDNKKSATTVTRRPAPPKSKKALEKPKSSKKAVLHKSPSQKVQPVRFRDGSPRKKRKTMDFNVPCIVELCKQWTVSPLEDSVSSSRVSDEPTLDTFSTQGAQRWCGGGGSGETARRDLGLAARDSLSTKDLEEKPKDQDVCLKPVSSTPNGRKSPPPLQERSLAQDNRLESQSPDTKTKPISESRLAAFHRCLLELFGVHDDEMPMPNVQGAVNERLGDDKAFSQVQTLACIRLLEQKGKVMLSEGVIYNTI